MADPSEVDDLERTLAGLAEALFAPGSVEGTLEGIVTLAEDAVDGCDGASVLVVADDGTAMTLAATNDVVATIDQTQIDAGRGPCLDAATSGRTVYAHDLKDDHRWPELSAAASEANIRCVLALCLSAERIIALNLFAELPAAFGATDRAKGQLFATLAGLALDSAYERSEGEVHSGHLHAALHTRELIGQAQGILMERERITADQAFAVLRRASQHLNIKVAAVAEMLIESGESPETGGI